MFSLVGKIMEYTQYFSAKFPDSALHILHYYFLDEITVG